MIPRVGAASIGHGVDFGPDNGTGFKAESIASFGSAIYDK
jgi:hypothetical protein